MEKKNGMIIMKKDKKLEKDVLQAMKNMNMISMGLAYFTNNVLIQMIVFIVVSLVTLLITKPLVKKFKKVDFVPTNSDRVIGKVGEVTKRITPDEYGEVKVYGTVWTAFSDDVLNVGDKVIITNIEGVKLIVKKEEK